MLGEYGNGGSKSTGRWEYVWLPTEDGQAIPVGVYKGGQIYALRTDHLGTPRRATNEAGSLVWQWPISGFGDNKPSGYLKATPNAKQALTNEPVLLRATSPSLELNLRFPGQYFDEETGLHYNLHRSYLPGQGRYTQSDPIGLGGGSNRFGYVGGMALSYTDPLGLAPTKAVVWLVKICKTGIQKIRPVSFEEAVRLAKKGEDLQASRDMAKKVANAASEGRGATKDPIHPDRTTGSTQGRRPHYHPNPRSGSHIFYNIAGAATLAGHVDCEDCALAYLAEGLDFFNPLSLPKDFMDLTGIGAPE